MDFCLPLCLPQPAKVLPCLRAVAHAAHAPDNRAFALSRIKNKADRSDFRLRASHAAYPFGPLPTDAPRIARHRTPSSITCCRAGRHSTRASAGQSPAAGSRGRRGSGPGVARRDAAVCTASRGSSENRVSGSAEQSILQRRRIENRGSAANPPVQGRADSRVRACMRARAPASGISMARSCARGPAVRIVMARAHARACACLSCARFSHRSGLNIRPRRPWRRRRRRRRRRGVGLGGPAGSASRRWTGGPWADLRS